MAGRRVQRAHLPQEPDAERVQADRRPRSEEHTSELQSQSNLVCRLLLEKKKEHHTTSMLTQEAKKSFTDWYAECLDARLNRRGQGSEALHHLSATDRKTAYYRATIENST